MRGQRAGRRRDGRAVGGGRVSENVQRGRGHHVGADAQQEEGADQANAGGEQKARLGAVDEPPEQRVDQGEGGGGLERRRPGEFALRRLASVGKYR